MSQFPSTVSRFPMPPRRRSPMVTTVGSPVFVRFHNSGAPASPPQDATGLRTESRRQICGPTSKRSPSRDNFRRILAPNAKPPEEAALASTILPVHSPSSGALLDTHAPAFGSAASWNRRRVASSNGACERSKLGVTGRFSHGHIHSAKPLCDLVPCLPKQPWKKSRRQPARKTTPRRSQPSTLLPTGRNRRRTAHAEKRTCQPGILRSFRDWTAPLRKSFSGSAHHLPAGKCGAG